MVVHIIEVGKRHSPIEVFTPFVVPTEEVLLTDNIAGQKFSLAVMKEGRGDLVGPLEPHLKIWAQKRFEMLVIPKMTSASFKALATPKRAKTRTSTSTSTSIVALPAPFIATADVLPEVLLCEPIANGKGKVKAAPAFAFCDAVMHRLPNTKLVRMCDDIANRRKEEVRRVLKQFRDEYSFEGRGGVLIGCVKGNILTTYVVSGTPVDNPREIATVTRRRW